MSKIVIGIRREDKNKWETRVPLVPDDAAELIRDNGFRILVQPSEDHRAFADDLYIDAGAEINEDLSEADIIIGVKEIPEMKFLPEKAYMFFAHVIKGQPYNMPMLNAMLQKNCTLIDYEKIESPGGKRLIFFGRYAGIAGMVESLSAYGHRLCQEGIDNPLLKIEQPYRYGSLAECIGNIWEISAELSSRGLPDAMKPFICGITGYGNVSKGAQEILDLLPVRQISADELRKGIQHLPESKTGMYKVVFEEKDMFRPRDASRPFVLQEYYDHPERYESTFMEVAPLLSIMVNCIFWTDACPRLLTKKNIRTLYRAPNPRLKVIGDISCDIEGSVEATVTTTDLDTPCFVYDVDQDYAVPGLVGNGPAIMAIENLPCEIPLEASSGFSNVLKNLFPGMAKADFSKPLEKADFQEEIKGAVVVLKGKLTPKYRYIEQSLIEHT
jgi:saccharopine dehydrogenase (NAD+, L-lysine forming)